MALTRREQNGVVWYTADGISAVGGTVHGFSTRLGGVSRPPFDSLNLGLRRGDDLKSVAENYRRFCAALGARADNVVFSAQVHGDTIRTVTSADWGHGLSYADGWQADGLITDVPGVPLVVFSADCVPILLSDPGARAVGAVHAGWRGTALGTVERAVEQMTALYGARPEEIRAAIGPSIGPCCFLTHDDVPDAMQSALGQSVRPYITPLPDGRYQVDLKGINFLRLRRAGVLAEHIEVSPLCTACHPEEFWSHRVLGEQRGNMAALIQLL